MTSIILTFFAGALLGFRYKVFVLVLGIAMILGAPAFGAGVMFTGAMLFSLELGYLAGSILSGWPRRSLRTQEY